MKKILFYNSGGGLGDSIQLFTLILSLKNHFKDSDISSLLIFACEVAVAQAQDLS